MVSKSKLFSLICAVSLMSAILYGNVGISQSPESTVQLTTEPPISQLFPFEAEAATPQSPVKLKLQAIDKTGIPLENAKISLTILTPPKNPWLPTDFPIVEGTTLLEMDAIAPKGELAIEQMLPIRGTYQLLVNVTPIVKNAFAPIQQTFTLSVPENGVKYRNFAILCGILLIVGIGGGFVIGGQQEMEWGEIAPTRVRLLLSGAIIFAIAVLLFVNISAELVASGTHQHGEDHHHHETAINTSGSIPSQGLDVQISGDNTATVGQLANLNIQVIDTQNNQPLTDAILNIKSIQLEDEWIAFAYQSVPNSQGELTWKQQFFDGAPHKIEVEVAPAANSTRQFEPFQVSKMIEVAGVEPPLVIRLIALAYLTGIVVVGLLIGLTWGRNKLKLVNN